MNRTGLQNIGIDVRMARHTGIGRYIRGTVSALSPEGTRFRYSLIGLESMRAEFPSQFAFIGANVPIYSLREQFVMPQVAQSLDCLHVPHYNAPLLWKRKLVVTVHDLIHLHFSDYLSSPLARWYAKTMLPQITRKADAIIAVSEYTKKDLVETLDVDPKKVTVIHHGVSPNFLDQNGGQSHKQDHEAPYFLYVGLMKRHKNLGVLLSAFQNMKKRLGESGGRLYLVGTPDRKQADVRKWLSTIDQDPDISLLTNIEDHELKDFYHNATALVFPSLYEGFGFPLIEAMASRTAVIASRAASIPEVLGDRAAVYFDPHSPSELEHSMEQVLRDSNLRRQLQDEGTKRLKSFSWNEAGKKTEQVYESILGTH